MEPKMDDRPSVSRASSATEGFFQSFPVVLPQYTSSVSGDSIHSGQTDDDPILARILAMYLPHSFPAEIDRHLHVFARLCLSSEVLKWTVDAETSAPTLHPISTFGTVNEVDALRTGEGWRKLKGLGIENGTVALGYDTLDGKSAQWNRRIYQMAMNHLWAASAALVTCPAAMTDGAAVLLERHVDDDDFDQPGRSAVLRKARDRLISFDPSSAWTSGQWMTERSGGSDISQTETTATRLSSAELKHDLLSFGSQYDTLNCLLGPWKIDGFKWFSSATDANMVVMLARTARGLSTFFAPMRRMRGSVSVMNGVTITRLKNKLGTKALPTAEVEIKSMRGWLIGKEGEGVKEIASILNITRVWTACGAIGGLARGLAVARAYARVRSVRGALLQDNPHHLAWMAEETVKYRAYAHLAFVGAALLGVVEQGEVAVRDVWAAQFLPSEQTQASTLLRLLVPIMKAQCSVGAVNGLRECMESLGGLGYCENNDDGGVLNIARIFRDTNVNPIWEGTVSVMVEDVVRVLKGKGGHEATSALDGLIRRLSEISRSSFEQECSVILATWSNLKLGIKDSDAHQLLYAGRTLLGRLESIVCSLLLMADAVMAHDATSTAVASRWMSLKFDPPSSRLGQNWRDTTTADKDIFLGSRRGLQRVKASL